ncbi:MAG: class I SAM-dependent methyltransferase [Bryobacteraceae bacterium]|nr:class I SAM-dependent methyltransferase [Bryobacteraceae bacterium]
MSVRDVFRLIRAFWVYWRFREYTMIGLWSYAVTLVLAEKFRDVSGLVVECGVWRGGMIAGMARILGPKREYILCDSFEGLPPGGEKDGEAAIAWQLATHSPFYFDNCKAEEELARAAMALSRAGNFQCIKGWFKETLPLFRPKQEIAILRLDCDWYESIKVCLEHLYKYVRQDGIIIIDDYYLWDGCPRAVHEFLTNNAIPDRIHEYRGVCYLVKESQSVLVADNTDEGNPSTDREYTATGLADR